MEQRQQSIRWILAGIVLVPALVVGLLIGGGFGSTVAQDATPGAADAQAAASRPAHIHTGSCAEGELGDIVAPLTDVTAPTGQGAGQRNRAATAETSFTTVALTLDEILADDHAINVHLSADQIETYIACGEIGGVVDPATGALVIGLREQNNSGFTGIAYLAPSATGAGTDVSLFIAETQRGGRRAAATPGAGGTTDADETEEDATGTPTS